MEGWMEGRKRLINIGYMREHGRAEHRAVYAYCTNLTILTFTVRLLAQEESLVL